MHKIALDFSGTIPLHHQLTEALREKIMSGELRPGEHLPSERELCTDLGLSRGTVRQSLSSLVTEGLAYTQRGRGNFVASHKIEQALLSFPSMVLDLQRGSHRVATRPLGVEIVPSSAKIARKLSVEEGATVIKIQRLRLLDDEPFLLTTSIVPEPVCPQLASDDHELRTAYELLQQKYGIPILRVKSTLETTLLDSFEADLLSVQSALPAFHLERIAFTTQDVPIVFTTHIIRGDRCRFSFELSEQISVGVPAVALAG